MKLNNKGQTLVAFIILLPVFIMIFTLIVDLGLLSIEKRKVDNEIKSTITYGLKNIETDNLDLKLRKLILKNIDNINNEDIKIRIENNYIKISLKLEKESLFKIIGKEKYDIYSSYIGIIENNEIKLKKE